MALTMTRKLRTFYTTEAVAELVGMSGTNARNRITSGEWKPSAQTSSGKALFSEAAVSQIAARESERAARRKGSDRLQDRADAFMHGLTPNAPLDEAEP